MNLHRQVGPADLRAGDNDFRQQLETTRVPIGKVGHTPHEHNPQGGVDPHLAHLTTDQNTARRHRYGDQLAVQIHQRVLVPRARSTGQSRSSRKRIDIAHTSIPIQQRARTGDRNRRPSPLAKQVDEFIDHPRLDRRRPRQPSQHHSRRPPLRRRRQVYPRIPHPVPNQPDRLVHRIRTHHRGTRRSLCPRATHPSDQTRPPTDQHLPFRPCPQTGCLADSALLRR